jgi:hypothetical protein
MDEEKIIPFTPQEYGVTLEIIVSYANLLIEDDNTDDPVDPIWPKIMEFFQSMHGATLKPRPRDNSPLEAGIPEVAKGPMN